MSHYQLTGEQTADLNRIWRRLNDEPDRHNGDDDDALARDDLDSWIAGVLGNRGRVRSDAVRQVFHDGQMLPTGTKARLYYDEVHEIVRGANVVSGRSLRPWLPSFVASGLKFVFLFVLMALFHRYVLRRNWETAGATAAAVAAMWTVFHAVRDYRRARRSQARMDELPSCSDAVAR